MSLQHRKAKHREFVERMCDRKRVRRRRAELSRAYARARIQATAHSATWRALDERNEDGWIIESSRGAVDYESSRDRARAEAKRRSETPTVTLEQAMLELGYEETGNVGTIEQRWRKVST